MTASTAWGSFASPAVEADIESTGVKQFQQSKSASEFAELRDRVDAAVADAEGDAPAASVNARRLLDQGADLSRDARSYLFQPNSIEILE